MKSNKLDKTMKKIINFFKELFFEIFILDNNLDYNCNACQKQKIVHEQDTFDIDKIPDEHFKDINLL